MVMLCVRLLLENSDSIIIAQRADVAFAPNSYGLIGGRVELDECASSAVVRKAREEAGITVNPAHIFLAHTIHRKSSETPIIILFFKIARWQGAPYNRADHKYRQIHWCNLSALPSNLMAAHRQALDLIARGVAYSEHDW